MIRNHLRLNIIIHLIQIALFIASASIFDWTHVAFTDKELTVRVYHVSLLLISEEDSVLQKVWLYYLTDLCLKQNIDVDSVPEQDLIPDSMCDRAGSLFFAGALVSTNIPLIHIDSCWFVHLCPSKSLHSDHNHHSNKEQLPDHSI